jgi:exodeoxyribonuclease VII small subunit
MNEFEKNMQEIETIISKIDKGEVDLAQLSKEVERAKTLILSCRQELRNIKSNIDDLVNKNE